MLKLLRRQFDCWLSIEYVWISINMYTKTSFIRWIHYNICKSHYMYIPARTPNHATWPSTRRAQGNWLVIIKSISFFFQELGRLLGPRCRAASLSEREWWTKKRVKAKRNYCVVYEHNKCFFKLHLNEDIFMQRVSSWGRLFQNIGPVNMIVFFAKIVRVRGRWKASRCRVG